MTARKHKPSTQHSEPTTVPAGISGFFGRPSTARIVPFATYMAFIAIADLFERLGATPDQLRWLYPVKTAAVVAALLAYRHHYTELAWRTMRLRQIGQAVVVGIVVFVLWVSLDASWMQLGASTEYNPTGPDRRIDWLLVVCRIAGAALVVPVMEELFWRSFLMRWLERHAFLNVYPASVGMKAIAITALLFGFEHKLWLAGIVAGIAYSMIYRCSGNLWSAVLAHATTNGVLGVWIVATASWTYW